MPLLALVLGTGLVVAASALVRWRMVAERRRTDDFMQGFGAPVERARDLGRAAAWFRAREGAPDAPEALDERTWRDLDMDDVWAQLDRTASQPGAQVLYDRLRRPAADASELARFDTLVEHFRSSPERCARVTHELLRLRAWHVSYLPDLMQGTRPPETRQRWLFACMALLMVALALLVPFWPRALIAILALFLVNYLTKLALRPRIDPFVPSLRALPILIGVAERLARQHDAALDEVLRELRRHRPALRVLKGASRWVSFEAMHESPAMGALADVARSFQEYLNVAFLLDVNAFHFAMGRIAAEPETIRAVFAAVGTLDAAIAVASVRHGWADGWCRPEATGQARQLHVDGARHPLLADAVANDFAPRGGSWLITGSNMSGKSTFLRTVGVNAVLARSIHTVRATSWRGALLTVRSCIGRSDSILEGRSYYLTEVEAVRGLLEASREAGPHLFILDELFRGTNTVERVAAARAVLEVLDTAPHLVLVATHDIELLRWLSPRYAAWHFREQVDGGELRFDYRLRPGPSSTRNAVALLRLKGYPDAVVQLAEVTVAEVEGGAQQQRAPGRE